MSVIRDCADAALLICVSLGFFAAFRAFHEWTLEFEPPEERDRVRRRDGRRFKKRDRVYTQVHTSRSTVAENSSSGLHGSNVFISPNIDVCIRNANINMTNSGECCPLNNNDVKYIVNNVVTNIKTALNKEVKFEVNSMCGLHRCNVDITPNINISLPNANINMTNSGERRPLNNNEVECNVVANIKTALTNEVKFAVKDSLSGLLHGCNLCITPNIYICMPNVKINVTNSQERRSLNNNEVEHLANKLVANIKMASKEKICIANLLQQKNLQEVLENVTANAP